MSDNIPVDYSRFLFEFPVFWIGRRNANGILLATEITIGKQDHFIVLFSDTDLADEFIHEHPEPGIIRMPIRNVTEWKTFLEGMIHAGLERFIFDPTAGKEPRFTTASSELRRLQN